MKPIFDEHRKEYERLLKECKDRGYKSGWVYHKMLDKYGKEIADKICEYNDVYEEW